MASDDLMLLLIRDIYYRADYRFHIGRDSLVWDPASPETADEH